MQRRIFTGGWLVLLLAAGCSEPVLPAAFAPAPVSSIAVGPAVAAVGPALSASSDPRLRGPGARGAEARNVVLLIGDGLSQTTVTLARLMHAGPLALDPIQVGSQSTAALNALIPDSAATATAMATGVNTINGAIGVDAGGRKRVTLLEAAEARGLATGLVTSTRITHATPAAFAAHVAQRIQENAIAEQLLHSGADVLIGGGANHFLPVRKGGRRPDNRDLFAMAKEAGWRVVRDAADLAAVEAVVGLDDSRGVPLLAVLADSHLPYRLDVEHALANIQTVPMPPLSELTRMALDLLDDDPQGFFLMVEGGRIDHAEHQHDALRPPPRRWTLTLPWPWRWPSPASATTRWCWSPRITRPAGWHWGVRVGGTWI